MRVFLDVNKQVLDELTIKDLRNDVSIKLKTKERAKVIYSRYEGIDREGTVYFSTNSGTTPGVRWHQRVNLLDLEEAISLQAKDSSMTNIDVVNLAIFGDVKVYCDDPSFLYWSWKYQNWELGSGLDKETRAPKRNNVKLEGMTCKHLHKVLYDLPFHMPEIVRDLVTLGVLKKRDNRKKREESPEKEEDNVT